MLIIDIETRRDDGALKLYNEVVPIKVSARLKKPETIARHQEEQAEKRHEDAALLPWTGRIVSIAYGTLSYPEVEDDSYVCETAVSVGTSLADEPGLLREFWERVVDHSATLLIGYNILQFDIPFILVRSMIHEIKPTRIINLARYRTSPVYDLMQLLMGWDMKNVLKLDVVCQLLGIENPLPGVEGSQVEAMTDEELVTYGEAEVAKIFGLYKRMELFYG
jgi:DNA polymerase elongation subunit (family B)